MKKYIIGIIGFFFSTLIVLADDPNIKFVGDRIAMSNGSLNIVFQNDDEFKLLGFTGLKQPWMLSPDDNRLIWQMSVAGNENELMTINSVNARYKGAKEISSSEEKAVIFEWAYQLEDTVGKVFMTVTLNKENTLSNWKIQSEFPAKWAVTDLHFPIITLPKATNTNLIMPAGWGAEYDLDSIGNTTFNNYYPSSRATVQLMSMYRGTNVFYFATHDPDASIKVFSARVSKENVELSNKVTTSDSWNKDGKFTLPWEVSLGVSNEGWENAVAAWYRPFTFDTQWGAKRLKDKSYPDWLLNADLWLTGGHTEDKVLQIHKDAIAYFGERTPYHWYYWHNAAFDTKYPEYLPAKPGFEPIVDFLQSNGSHVMPYINGRLWDTTTVSYHSNEGIAATVLKKDQTPVIEVYASKAPNAVICPSSVIWGNILTDLTDKIQGDVVGTDGVYFDQVASARAVPCWNNDHDHPLGGGTFWVDSYRKIFSDVRSVLEPGHIIATEQNAEPYLDMFDLFLMVNYPQGNQYRPVPLYSIIYSDRALLYGFYIYNKNDMSYRIKNALTLLWGAQLNGGRTSFVMAETMTDNREFLRNLAVFRKSQHDLFNGGQFLKEIIPEGENPILSIPNWASTSAAVRGSLWKSVDDEYAVLLVNIDNEAHKVELPYSEGTITLGPGQCHRLAIDRSKLNRQTK